MRITDTTIEIFIKHNRIASHRRLYGRPGQNSTITEHVSEDHQKYLEWSSDRFRKWAAQIGINTSEVVNSILTSGRVEQQSHRSCMGLLKLAEKYTPAKMEAACQKALSYKSIKNLLVTMKDEPAPDVTTEEKRNSYGITRGARNYTSKSKEVITMINQSTIDKLIEMHLTAMSDAFRIQMDDKPRKMFSLKTVLECWLRWNTPVEKTID